MTGLPPPSFSDRERDVIDGIRCGLSYKEIGQACNISPHTVRAYVIQIAQKIPEFQELPPRWRIYAYVTATTQDRPAA